jgi:hypothetical protein
LADNRRFRKEGDGMRRILVTASLFSASASCFATDDYNKTPANLGAQAPSTGYFYVAEGWSQPCANGVMYIDLTTAAGKSMWAEVLAAKAMGKPIHWVNYTVAGGNVCTANLIEVS